MAQDSGFGKNGGSDGENNAPENEMQAGPTSMVRTTPCVSGTYRLRVVHDTVVATLGPKMDALERLFKVLPKTKILWDTIVDIGANISIVENRLDATITEEYFFS